MLGHCEFFSYTSMTDYYEIIKLEVDFLKSILKFDKSKMEYFINIAMHELGHSTQAEYHEGRRKYIIGLEEIEDESISKGQAINEVAETINATRLHKGNISSHQYLGYESVKDAVKVVLSSLGISELELANLQFSRKSRDNYESLIAKRLGNVPSKLYVDSFEEITDTIMEFAENPKERENLISQVDALQTLSTYLFKERYADITVHSDNMLMDLAKLCIDQENRDDGLKNIFSKFRINPYELQICNGMDIYKSLLEQGKGQDFILKLSQHVDWLKAKQQWIEHLQSKKVYDNEELMEKVYQSFQKYPIMKVPAKDRAGVLLSKAMGAFKKQFSNNGNTKLLPTTNHDRHMQFANKISYSGRYSKNKANKHNIAGNKINNERGETGENSR